MVIVVVVLMLGECDFMVLGVVCFVISLGVFVRIFFVGLGLIGFGFIIGGEGVI